LKLIELKKNDRAVVKKIEANSDLKQRFFSFGLVRGAEIKVIDSALNNSTMEIKIGNTLLALRGKEAKTIEVEKVN
jgi:ferrous iron transport protein A